MRRLLALWMIVVFGGFTGAPLLMASTGAASGPLSTLPACCRAKGAHRCMLRMHERDAGGIQIESPQHCPFFPKWRPMHATHHEAAAPRPAVFYAELQMHPACQAQTEARRRISFDRSRQKRGPPAVAI